MDNGHTQHQKSTTPHSGDQDEKEQEEKGEKLLNHDGQIGSNNLEDEPVDNVIDHENVSVVQDKKEDKCAYLEASKCAWAIGYS